MKASIALLAFCLLPFSLRAAETAKLPVEDFFKDSVFSSLRLSPDGQKLLALSMWKGHRNIFVIDMKTKQPTLVTGFKDRDVDYVRWVGSKRVIYNTYEKEEYNLSGLFAINIDGSNPATLGGSFLSPVGDSTSEILIVATSHFDVYRVKVRNGHSKLVARNPEGVKKWVADHNGVVRAGFGEDGREQFMVYRASADEPFKKLKTWDFLDGGIEPLAFDRDNRYLYVRSGIGRDKVAICLFDPSTGKEVKALFSDPVYNADDVVLSHIDHSLLGFTCDRDKRSVKWVDKRMGLLQTLIDREFPATLNVLGSRSDDEKWILVYTYSDRNPGTYYLLNTEKPSLEKLVSIMPWIKPAQMAEMRPITYQSRDGLTIHGYLTLPVGSSGKNLPLIVNPHGGPWLRDNWGYSREVQFLANRGYAVLQMNFRGSTGYGGRFFEAGFGEWGLKMQDDITDGVKWAIKEGIADPHRITIYGASYGGYATMAGLAFTPDLYRCGVNYVGVTDIKFWLKTMPRAWEKMRAQIDVMTGNAKRDSTKLEATSPMDHVDQIKAPVFLAYGVLDPRVDYRNGTRIAKLLKKHHVPVELMIRSVEGHGYHLLKNKVAFYTEMERFLAKYMRN